MDAIQTVLGMDYKVFDGGSYVSKMPDLVSAGFVPIGVADVMRARVENKGFWLNNYFSTGDGVSYLGGKVKLALAVPALVNINPDAVLRDGALPLSVEGYGVLSGVEFSRRDLERAGINKRLSEDEVNAHPVWLFLAGDDKHLLSEYAGLIFSEGKERFGYDEMMGIYLNDEQPKSPVLRAWVVDRLYDRSLADGSNNLLNLVRLVGVRSSEKARSAALQKGSLDEKILNALNDGKAFDYNGQLYVPVAETSGLNI